MKTLFRKAVFIVTYRINPKTKPKKIEYLILKRKLHWIGWEFPKGGVEKGENLKSAVKRETFEETGNRALKIKQFNISGKYKYHKKFSDRPSFIGQTYHLFSAEVKGSKVKIDKREHSDYKWLPFSKAAKILKHNNQKKCLRVVNKSLGIKQ